MSWVRRFTAPLAAAALFCSLAVPVAADPSITISPDTGVASDAFEVAGSGFPVDMALDISFVSPSGTVFSTVALKQVEAIDADGNFSFAFVPATEFSGETQGDWTAQVCLPGADSCVQTAFTVGP